MSWLGTSRPLKLRQFHSSDGCAELQNRGTHFTVDLESGTPAQTFSVVADTGSDSIIIPSCVCQKMGYCLKSDRCFVGTNHSSSFAITKPPLEVMITFGSGPIRGVVSSDYVTVGHVRQFMKEGVLLMTEKELNFAGSFEGILGLGLPSNATPRKAAKPSAVSGKSTRSIVDDILKKIMGGNTGTHLNTATGGAGAPVSSPMIGEGMQMKAPLNETSPELREAVEKIVKNYMGQDARLSHQQYIPVRGHTPPADSSPTSEFRAKSFLETAGISRFSLCFNDGASGVLRLGTPQQPQVLGSVGSFHWGLDLQGISVGALNSTVAICSPSSMKPGQKSACGAIPDSGTTAIMAPAAEIKELHDHICDNWSRCRQNYTAIQKAGSAASKAASDIYGVDPFGIEDRLPHKDSILKLLLLDCNSWLTKDQGLHELPDIHFHLRGAGGETKKVALSAWAYVMETFEHEVETVYKNVGGYKIPYKRRTGIKTKVCTLNIAPMAYETEANGPIFILGTPLFYEFEVGYDLGAKPPGISFRSLASLPCGSCRNDTAFFSDSVTSTSKLVRSPRQVHTPLRVPQMDLTQPL